MIDEDEEDTDLEESSHTIRYSEIEAMFLSALNSLNIKRRQILLNCCFFKSATTEEQKRLVACSGRRK